MPRITCTRLLAWDAAHRIPRHESKCAALHGHRYTAEITCAAEALDDIEPATGTAHIPPGAPAAAGAGDGG